MGYGSVVSSLSPKEVIERLSPFLTAERKARIDQVVSERIFDVQVLLENIYDRGNISAVMRTAEALGVFQFQIVDNQKNFKVSNRVTQGAERWLQVEEWESSRECVAHLKKQGFRIAVTNLNVTETLDKLDFGAPLVIAFGNERDGVSEELQALADIQFQIPMFGFTQSFNISVAAALCLQKIRESQGTQISRMDDFHREKLRAFYYQRAYEHSEKLLDA